MSKARAKGVTVEEVRDILNYDKSTGVFTWRKTMGQRAKEGARAGFLTKEGRLRIKINGQPYFGHRLAWLWEFGVWPDLDIDHVNGNPADNRLSNLREATDSQNSQNRRRGTVNSTSPYLGVSWSKSRNQWIAQIWDGTKKRFLGAHDSEEAAYAIYVLAKRQLHEFGTI